MATTQDYLPISEIYNDIVFLKDGGAVIVLQAGAVNFDLLSEREQLAIIDSFAGFLNSLSFMVQIVIRSRRLDITSYLHLLDKSMMAQTNPLLSGMMQTYRQFVAQTIKENDVLDKKFYIVIAVSGIELGIIKNGGKNIQKALTILIPRRDHVIRQFARIGLRLTQLDTEKLIKLFYDIYNEQASQELSTDISLQNQIQSQKQSGIIATTAPTSPPNTNIPTPPFKPVTPPPPANLPPVQPQQMAQQPQRPAAPAVTPLPSDPTLSPQAINQAVGSQPQAAQPTAAVRPQQQTQPQARVQQPLVQRQNNASPYVVEELPDDYGTV